MDLGYSVFLLNEVVDVIRSMPRSDRAELRRFVDSLAKDPTRGGDFREESGFSSETEIKIVGKFAVYFVADHAVKEVKVIKVVSADRGHHSN